MKIRKLYIFLAAFCIIVLTNTAVFAQKTNIKVDGSIIKSYIEYMASDDKLGRQTLTPTFDECIDWAGEKFREWGLEPAGENGTYFQNVPIVARRGAFAWSSGIPELRIDGREFYVNDSEFTIDTRSATGVRITGEVVFAGYGISAPGKGLDEYAGLNVRGKYVLVFKGSPKDAPPPMRGFFAPQEEKAEEPVEEWKEESKDDTKIMTAYDKGAAGIILYDPKPQALRRYFGLPGSQKIPFDRQFMVVSDINATAFRSIMTDGPQESLRTFSTRIDNIRRDIKNKITHSKNTRVKADVKGYDSTTMYGKDFGNNISRNVLAKLEGTDRRLKNEYIVIGGHYDHLGMGNGIVYNGADDNASGSAVTMEIARLLKKNNFKPKRTIIFALWCGEEMGLLGSRYYVENPCDGVVMDKVVTNFNMDMVGLGDQIGAPGALNFPEIYDVITRDQDPDILEAVVPSTGGPGGSDHSGFIEKGIEALALMTRGGVGHPDYHDSGDDTHKIDPEILRKTGQFVLQASINLANENKTNLLIPNRQDRYNAIHFNIININASLDIPGGWTNIDADNKHKLLGLARDKALELKKPQEATPMMYYRRGPRFPARLGIADSKVFEGCVATMNLVHSILDFGRIDVHGEDTFWFDNGLSSKGQMALKSMEKNNIVVHMFNPTKASLNTMFDTAVKPFIITGYDNLDNMTISRIKDKNALVTVEFDLLDVKGCIRRLEEMKQKFGGTGNLILYLNPAEKIDPENMEPQQEKMRELYMSLIDAGWTKKEIYAIGGLNSEGRVREGGNLGRLSGR